jgi:hypothetical protein
MWDVSLLLKNADQSLPDPVLKILATGDDLAQPTELKTLMR